AGSLRLDNVARAWGAYLFVTGKEYGDRQGCLECGAADLPDGFERCVVAALHVENARSVAFAAVAAPRQFLQGANGVNRVHVPGDQNAGCASARMRETCTHASAKSVASGNMLDAGTGDRHVARGEIEHAVDSG